MLPCFVVLDLETTGAHPVHDRVTEIAAVRIEDGREVARWSTLVNPGMSIPPFVQGLTGISDQMVASAQPFTQVAPQLLALLDGAVLVAHNARFDHGFLKNEFDRMGVDLRVRTLCTVRLSRKLNPEHRSHGLDALMQRHGLQTQSRHRAMGDVDVLLAWLRQIEQTLGLERLRAYVQALLAGLAAQPSGLQTPLESVPEGPGVYLFYGEGALPLYIGKSVHLRSRVKQHFQADHKVTKEMRISQEVRRIEWRETAGELGALLLEARLVKELQPVHNRRLRRQTVLCAWKLQADPSSRPAVVLVDTSDVPVSEVPSLFGPYRSRRQAMQALRELATLHQLCPQQLGLTSGKGRCFAHQLGQCLGVCCEQESPQKHQLRMRTALQSQQLEPWPFAGKVGLREHDERTGRTDMHVLEHWCHVGTVTDESELGQVLESRHALVFDLDIYRVLSKHLLASQFSQSSLVRFDAVYDRPRKPDVTINP